MQEKEKRRSSCKINLQISQAAFIKESRLPFGFVTTKEKSRMLQKDSKRGFFYAF